jgi:photosystem II stability/assembly factor-like uncharacterized protein
MKIFDRASLEGRLYIRVYRIVYGVKIPIGEYLDSNLITLSGLELITLLLTGEPGNNKIVKVGVGDGTAMTHKADTGLTNAYIKDIDYYTFDAPNVINYKISMDTGDGNGLNISEFGLFSGDEQLFSRKIQIPVIPKDSDIIIEGNWVVSIFQCKENNFVFAPQIRHIITSEIDADPLTRYEPNVNPNIEFIMNTPVINTPSLEPWNMERQLYVEDPSQSSITAAGYDSTNDEQYVATMMDAQIWKSSDGGSTWALMWDLSNEATASTAIHSLTHDSVNDAMYCCAYPYGLVYKSTDQGVTWTLSMDQGIGIFQFVSGRIGYDPVADILYCGLSDSIGNWGANLYQSIDQGANWTLNRDFHIAEPFVDGIETFVYDSVRDRMYLGTSGRAQVWQSDDAGANWTKVIDFLSLQANTINTRLAIDTSRDILIAATGNDGRIWTSIDAGANWIEKIRLEIVEPYISSIPCLVYNPGDTFTYLGGGSVGAVMVSEDGGSTWAIDKDDFNDEDSFISMAYGNGKLFGGTGPRAEIWTRTNG